ncbi:MAG: YfhO family protein [Clostridiales bacterium]|nr:YfhO family protein [Clostridiales bacterium]
MWGKPSPILKEKRGTFGLLIEYWPQFLLAFLFPALTVLAAFAVTGCYPFGDRTILTVDLYHQYCPFLVAFRDKVLSGESLFYSWNDGLGQEYYAAYANYAASPLNIFSLFFTAKTMPVFIEFVTCFRAGLASLFMLLFLSSNDNRRIDNITVVFSSSYALCGWFISFFWNIMWCDAVVLLPLIALGLKRLLADCKVGLYIVTLAIAIASNYYAGYFICLFMVIFAPAYYFCLFSGEKPKGDPGRLCFKTFIGAAFRFAFSSILAAGASAALTIPTYLILKNCSATGDQLKVDYGLQNDLFDFFGRLMVAANPNIRDGMANVYSGIVIVLLLPLFFLLPKRTGIKLKHKIVFGVLLAVMYLSLTNRTLNFIWHGMHFPNQIPYRESFIMSFLLVFIGFLTIRRIRSLGVKYVTGAVLSSAAFLILYEKFGSGNEGYLQIGVTLLFLIIQGAALHTVSNINVKKSEFFLETLLTVTMMVEMFAASLITIGLVCKHEGFTSYAPYGRNHEEVHAYVEQAEGSEGHMNFERSELYPNNVCDLQSLYNVKGLSIFSSTARESFVKYMRNFGFHNNNINGLRNAGLTRVTATLLNVRNLVEIDKTQAVPALFEQEYKGKVISSWANKDALSVGFMTDPAVIDYAPDYDNDLNVFSKTNDWVKSMGAEDDVYKPVTLIAGDTSGLMTVDRECSAMAFTTSSNVQNNEYSFNVTVKDADIGSDIYLYANSKKGGNVTITCGDKTRKFEIRSFQIISCGVFDGTPIEVYVKYSESPSSNITLYGYQLDRAGYDRMLEKFSDEQLFVSEYDTTSLSGHIDVKEDGLLFLSIPYAEGWSAVVDGENAEITPIQDALMGIRLKAGSHDISLKYTPAGFKAGLIISIVSVIAIALIISVSFIISRKKAAKANAAEKPFVPVEEGSSDKAGAEPEEPSEAGAAAPVEEVSLAAVMNGEDSFSGAVNESDNANVNSAEDGSYPEVKDE